MQFNSTTVSWQDWLHRRGITDEVILMFGLHTGEHPMFGECLVIPVSDGETTLFNKYRRLPEDPRKPKYITQHGTHPALYGWHLAKNHPKILITEGEMDALVAWSAGIPAVSSTGGALSFFKEWAEWLTDKEVLICYDNDAAGGDGMVKVLSMVPHAKVIFLPDLPTIKDVSDYVSHAGNLHELVHTAKHFGTNEHVADSKVERLALFKSIFFHTSWEEHQQRLHLQAEKTTRTALNNSKLEKAKCFPISKLITFVKHKAPCIWHNEHTPSLHYFPDTNTVYCFGCGKYGDAIDVYRALHGGTFTQAVEQLL